MAHSYTGAEPLPVLERIQRFFIVGWTFLVIYVSYKWVQRKKIVDDDARAAAYAKVHQRSAERIYRLSARMEGLMIKTCQFISSRADVAPPEYVAVLSRLQDRVPPSPFSSVVGQVRRELGAHPDEIFDNFARRPIASASLAQVHRARTKDGRDVAVKVQYPGIDRVIETDLHNIARLVTILAKIEKNFDFRIFMDEVCRTVPRELDFLLEGRSAERVTNDLAHRKDIKIPKIDWDHSARRVLTMEYIEATKISDIPALQAQGIDPNQVAQIMTEAYCEQILIHGYFHADPHPGNLYVLPGPIVVFFDFGLSKELPPEFRKNYARLTIAIMTQNNTEMVNALRAIGFRTKSEDPEALIALGASFFEMSGPDAKAYMDADVMPEVNERLARILAANPVTAIPADILLIFRVIGLMSGLQKRLDSRVNLADTILPYAEAEAAAHGVTVPPQWRPVDGTAS